MTAARLVYAIRESEWLERPRLPCRRRGRRAAGAAARAPRVRSHCRLRGTDYLSESGMKWMSGNTKRQCDRARRAPRARRTPSRRRLPSRAGNRRFGLLSVPAHPRERARARRESCCGEREGRSAGRARTEAHQHAVRAEGHALVHAACRGADARHSWPRLAASIHSIHRICSNPPQRDGVEISP